MRILGLLLGLSCLHATEVAGPDGFSEIFKMPGASFKLELEGPYLTSKDRALIREAGGGCPGRSDAADSDQRRFALSVATYVYHSQGSYEPSPLVHGGPIVAGANTPGRLKASWYPVQLRMPGSFRICYCAASDEVEFAESSGVVLGPNDSPCDLDYASYRLVGVAYAMGIKHSEVPIGSCLVSGHGTLQSACQVHVRADRGGLSAEDMAELVSGDPSAICGEAPAGVSLQPLQGDAFSWTFQVPVGADTKDSYELQTTSLGLHRVLKICYCEKQSTGSQFSICSQADWQNAGSLSLVGFDGSPADARCYRGQRCRLGRPAFGMSKGDAAISIPGNSSCANLDSISIAAPAPISITGGSTAVANIDVETYEGDLATICFCSAGVHGTFGCQLGEGGRVFNMLMGYVRSGGLKNGLRMDCVPTSMACPATPTYLEGEDAEVAKRGKLFLAELKYRPCEDLTASDVQQARLLSSDSEESVRVEMPWPLLSGRYAICFCEDAIGCPQPNQVRTLQHIGELRVLGAIQKVSLTTHPGIATIPLQVQIVEEATGIRCCAETDAGETLDCVDLKASATNAAELLSHPGTFRFPLVLQEPLESYDRGLKLNVSCAAMGESGPCASSDGETSGGLDGFPCRQVHPLELQMQLPPVAWHQPWRRPVGGAVGTEAIAEAGGYATQVKAVATEEPVTKGICKNQAAKDFQGLPCQSTECTDLDTARATVPGHYELCVCEPGAVPMSQECLGWHHLGHLEVFGPLPLNSSLQGTVGDVMQIALQGVSLGREDSLVSVPLNSAPVNPETVCVGEGRLLPAQSTLYSPADWSASHLRFDVSLPEGIQALCWLPPGSALPYYVGFAEIFTERINIDGCLVTPWQLMQPCSASCGAGKEIWYRRVLAVLVAGADCTVFEEERFCMRSPCLAVVEGWEAKPPKPMQDEPMELQITGMNLSVDLHGVLVRDDGKEQASSPKQGLCHYASHVASMVKCSGSQEEQTCNFPQAPAGGGYQLCICMAQGPRCQAFLPALGTLRIEGLPEAEDDGSLTAALVISGSVVLLCGLPLLSPCIRRRLWGLWKKLQRKIFGPDSKVMAVPGVAEDDNKDDLSENVGDAYSFHKKVEEKMESISNDDTHSAPGIQTRQPEEEPSQCSTPRMDAMDPFTEDAKGPHQPSGPGDAPLQPEIPEAEAIEAGCRTPEMTEEEVEAVEAVEAEAVPEKSRKEKKRMERMERKEERRKAREEKRQERRKAEESAAQLQPLRPLPPPPLRAPPRKLPSLPVSPSFSEVRSPAAIEALADATMILQASNVKDGKLTDYGLSMKALSVALGRNDPQLVAKALLDAERAGVGRELLDKARQQLVDMGGGDSPPREAADCSLSVPQARADAAVVGASPDKGEEVALDQADPSPAPEAEERAALETFEWQKSAARAPEPPTDFAEAPTAFEPPVEGRDDDGVSKEEESVELETVERSVPEETAPEKAAEEDTLSGEERVQDEGNSKARPLLAQDGLDSTATLTGKAEGSPVEEDAPPDQGEDQADPSPAPEAEERAALETFEWQKSAARAPEPPTDCAEAPTAFEPAVEGRDNDGVGKEEESAELETPERSVLEETAPEKAAEEDTLSVEEGVQDRPEECMTHQVPAAHQDAKISEDQSAVSVFGPEDFPFSPAGDPSSVVCSIKGDATMASTGQVRRMSSSQESAQSVEWQVPGSVNVAEALASMQGVDNDKTGTDTLSLQQEPSDTQTHAADKATASVRTRSGHAVAADGWAASVYSDLDRQSNIGRADLSTPSTPARRSFRDAGPSAAPNHDELDFSVAQRQPEAFDGRGIADGSASSRSRPTTERTERSLDRPSASVADDFSFARQERTDRQTSGGMSDADLMFSLARQEQRHSARGDGFGSQRQRMDLPSSGIMERHSVGGLPKEKRKSTPIRPSLTGSTLIDGGTLMLWKSGDADASGSAKTPPPPPPRSGRGPPARPGSASGAAQRAGSQQRAASKRSFQGN